MCFAAIYPLQRVANKIMDNTDNPKFRRLKLESAKFANLVWKFSKGKFAFEESGWCLDTEPGYIILPLVL